MAKTYNGRFVVPKEPTGGSGWLVLGVILMVFGSFPGLVLGALSIAKFTKCKKEKNLFERFGKYCAVIGWRGRVPVRELSKGSERSVSDVRRDLQAMIAKGYFGEEAYLDLSEGCLVLPDMPDERSSSFTNWKDMVIDLVHSLRTEFNVQEAQYESVREEQKQPETPGDNVKQSYMDELERTLNELYQLNEQIQDENVSRRIDRIGELTGGIFRAVIENPEREADVRKFMNYYLPTTLKLLKAYDLMESQSYQGENILASRKKIEGVLDMLIEAYEKQLDRLFTNDALDIATDIDVLETMMAGDGLSSKGRMQI